MHIQKIVYIKTLKIAPTRFEPKIIFRELHCSSLHNTVIINLASIQIALLFVYKIQFLQ